MAHVIERAKSGRATCKTCQKPIAQGELRLCEETATNYGGRVGTRYHHVACAVVSKPAQLREALAAFEGELPERESLLAQLAGAPAEEPREIEFPFAERAPRAVVCVRCAGAIPAGELRVAVELREDLGSYVRMGASHLHAACAQAFGLADADAALIRTHSRGVSPTDLDAIDAALHG